MDTNIKQNIIQKLHDAEDSHGIKIIHAIESGSRGWGFAAKDADYDCRFLYVRPRDWYLSIQTRTEFIEYANDEVYDIRGYDISRALKYIIKPDTTIYEWLSSNEKYISCAASVNQLKALAADFFNPIPISWHYLKLAQRMLESIDQHSEAKIKKYFYILRPIANLNFIWQHGKMPYMEYAKTIAEIEMPTEVLTSIMGLMEVKLASHEHYKIPKQELLLAYFRDEIEVFEQRLHTMKHTKNRDYDQVDAVFKNIIEGAWV